MSSPLKVFCLLLLIHLSLSDYCIDVAFDDINSNVHQEFQVSPGNEMCLKYLLSDQKSKISLMFFGSNSPTSEVVIYKSTSDISLNYAYIIIRDTKDDDTNRGILYCMIQKYLFLWLMDNH